MFLEEKSSLGRFRQVAPGQHCSSPVGIIALFSYDVADSATTSLVEIHPKVRTARPGLPRWSYLVIYVIDNLQRGNQNWSCEINKGVNNLMRWTPLSVLYALPRPVPGPRCTLSVSSRTPLASSKIFHVLRSCFSLRLSDGVRCCS